MRASLHVHCLLGLALAAIAGASVAQSRVTFFRAYTEQPDALARRQFLVTEMPRLPPNDQTFARQLLAGTDAELGRYRLALEDFPFDQREMPRALIPMPHTLPTVERIDYHDFVNPQRAGDALPAAATIARAARDRRLVMINEAHHDPHTRELVLQLLPRLRALGFDHFAAEALIENGKTLAQRGYPITSSGTEYLHEPLYGEIVREALKLGYTLVPYDPTDATPDRDLAQAENLYQRVFLHHPKARLFVLTGYAHIDKAPGELGPVTPMAMRLQALTGIEPLSIDQTTFREIRPEPPHSIYRWVVAAWQPHAPVVLQVQGEDQPWSSDPKRYDISVILPPAQGRGRPDWLTLDGARHPYPIGTDLCANVVPCVVAARYAGETADAIAADRYAFFSAPGRSRLYLRPGTYQLRANGVDGRTLGAWTISVR